MATMSRVATFAALAVALGTATALSPSLSPPTSLRGLQADTMELDVCPSTFGTDGWVWSELRGTSPEDYQALFLLSSDGGVTFLDRTFGGDEAAYAATNGTGMEFGFGGFIFMDMWARVPSDVNATSFTVLVLPLSVRVDVFMLPLLQTTPGPLPAALLADVVVRVDQVRPVDGLSPCMEDLITTPVQNITDPDAEADGSSDGTTTTGGAPAAGGGGGGEAVKDVAGSSSSSSGALRNSVLASSWAVLASLLLCSSKAIAPRAA
jgi:hypothetical protein